MSLVEEKDLWFPKPATVDESGEVFFFKDRVLRGIRQKETADLYVRLLGEDWFVRLFDEGLVRTWVCDDLKIEGIPFILEHIRIPFQTHPGEWTSKMHWLAAKTMIRLNIALSQHGYVLKDSHSFNLMFHKGRPVFVDLGSIAKADRGFEVKHWLWQFKKSFALPIWLASTRWRDLALDYRRQQRLGFRLFERAKLDHLLLRRVERCSKYSDRLPIFFSKIEEWLDQHTPLEPDRGDWGRYQELHIKREHAQGRSPKQSFVYAVLSREKPKTVLDCAANLGLLSETAATLGADVVAFDQEEYCVNECLKLAQTRELSITPAIMDFKFPTPNYGAGLMGRNAFERFQADIVLALGLIHHVCLYQGLPVKLFCNICMNYAKRGVIVQYVDPKDKHLAAWARPIPHDYSLNAIRGYFGEKFCYAEPSETYEKNGCCRTLVYFHK